nr:MAG TPA: major capsid protein [Caudoviricetes sp.]
MGYRDIESTFGTASTATAATAKAFPNGIDFGEKANMGNQENAYFVFHLTDGAPTATEAITITIKGCDAKTGTYVTLDTQYWPQGAENRKLGSRFSIPIPWKHKRYVTAEVTTETSTGVAFFGYLTEGTDRA